jgi:hypothetical protein
MRRMGGDVAAAAAATGMTEEEVATGLWPAVAEFLAARAGEWALALRLHTNNGLTVLRRTAGGPCAAAGTPSAW